VQIHPDQVPLTVWDDGSIRIGNTRMLFYLVVEAFQAGQDPETIVRMFRSLKLADAYAVIAYYLRHEEEVRQWLVELQQSADELRRKIEAAQGPPRVTREILLARKAEMEKQRAATGK
jgi:uncharacterized protein (DUF433 family)